MARPQIPIAISAVALSLLSLIVLLHQLQSLPVHLSEWTTFLPKLQSPLLPLASQHNLTSGYIDDEYLLGVGKADITGPVVEINLMGYADPKQLGSGLRQRLFARAFIMGSLSNAHERIVYVVLDTQSGDTAVRYGILQGLADLGPTYAIYGPHNVAITGTHSHSGPGAWLNYLLPQITSKGFNKQSYDAIVSGTLLAIRKAHESLEAGHLTFGSTEIHDANINRSLWAYLNNPEEELDKYENNVDKIMTLLRFQRSRDGKNIGVLTWFPVHGTSMLGNNTLVTGDNKGVAAQLFEGEAATSDVDTISSDFVAGFSQSNVGDTSPNVKGAYCEDGSGQECSFETSLCGNISQTCHGRGPLFGLNDAGTKSCFEIGRRQFMGAKFLFDRMRKSGDTASVSIRGGIRSLHSFKDMSNYTFTHPNGSLVRTCSAALGYSFAAGTTDGPGAFDFKQNNSGDPNANPLWATVSKFIHAPSEDQIACQAPKPILLDVGATKSPYQWTPNIVDIQLFRVGQLFIIIAPGEATTMSGRRWKSAIANAASSLSLTSTTEPLVVLGGPANTYAHYIATEEEYGIQRYEGASTLYGPHTLNAYIHLTTTLLPYLSTAPSSFNLPKLDPGPSPPININASLSFITPVVFDNPGLFRSFGAVLIDVLAPATHIYPRGSSTVTAKFVGANPRNNLRLEGTFAAVERLREGSRDAFDTVRDDRDWDLVYRWRRTSEVAGTSEVEISWEVPETTEVGRYRLIYYGDRKSFGSGKIDAFIGRSGIFAVGD